MLACPFLLGACRDAPPSAISSPAINSPPAVAVARIENDSAPSPVAPPADSLDSSAPATRPNEWCIEGLSALDEETCYIFPIANEKPRELLIYLHGIVSPAPGADAQRVFQTIVMNASLRGGVVAMIPRGRRGIGPGASKDWWAWPTTPSDYSKYASAILTSFTEHKAALETIAGAPFLRTYLAGSSNGAYFLTTVALHGAFHADGFGAMSGGSASGMQPSALIGGPMPSFYVGIPTYDSTRDGALALGRLLAAAKWPNKIAEHPFGHGAREVYLDEAFAYWRAPHRD